MTPSKKPEATKQVTQPATTPQPQTTAAQSKPEPVNKQTLKVNELKEAWTKRGVDVGKLEQKPDGKNLLLMLPNFPPIVIGPTGGINLPTIRSYPKAWDAAVHGDEFLKKQSERDAKKATQSAKPATHAPAVQPSAKSDVTPAARKKAQHDEIEQRMA